MITNYQFDKTLNGKHTYLSNRRAA